MGLDVSFTPSVDILISGTVQLIFAFADDIFTSAPTFANTLVYKTSVPTLYTLTAGMPTIAYSSNTITLSINNLGSYLGGIT